MALVLARPLKVPSELKTPGKRYESCRKRRESVQIMASLGKQVKEVVTGIAMVGTLVFADPSWAATEDFQSPYTEARKPIEVGLLNGRIRPCNAVVNLNCRSTSSKSVASGAFPWRIPRGASSSPIEDLKNAILSTQKDAKIMEVTHLENGGDYLRAEVEGDFMGPDILEFLVQGDNVNYRTMAKKVLYIYPFTFSDTGRQQRRLEALEAKLGWGPPKAEDFAKDLAKDLAKEDDLNDDIMDYLEY